MSPDFIASAYCYEREFGRAMERHRNGEARVIPVIVRPCNWLKLFHGLLATPRDGKAISTWPNIDEAYLNVVQDIEAALQDLKPGRSELVVPQPATYSSGYGPKTVTGPRSSNLRIRKEFTDYDRDRFRHDGFEFILKFFENSMVELVNRNPGLDQRFRKVDADRFTATVYRNGEKICKATVYIGGGTAGRDGIAYSMDDDADYRGFNEAVNVRNDDQTLYFEALGMASWGNRDKEKLTPQGAAELFWGLFIQPLQH